MKKVSESRRESIENVKLYLDDLESIENCFREIVEDLTISIPGYEIEQVKELATLDQPTLSEIEFLSYNPHIRFSLHSYGTEIYISDDHPLLRGALEKIKAILLNRRSEATRLKRWAIISFVLGALGGLASIVATFTGWVSWRWYILVGALFVVGLGINFSRMAFEYRSIVQLRTFSAAPTFIEKHKDHIVLVMITAIITAIISALVTIMVSRVTEN